MENEFCGLQLLLIDLFQKEQFRFNDQDVVLREAGKLTFVELFFSFL